MSAKRVEDVSVELLEAWFDDAPIGVAVWHCRADKPLYVNQGLALMLGLTRDALLERGLISSVHPVDQSHALEMVATLSHLDPEDAESSTFDLRYIRPDSSTVWTTVSQSFILTESGAYLFVRVVDITSSVEHEARIDYQSLHDNLTGLPNRMLLEDRLSQALARRDRADAIVAVLHIDLDDFKSVNDSFGHLAGDTMIARISHRLRAMMRPGDTIARVGGDEFVVIAELEDVADAETFSRRIATSVEEVLVVDEHSVWPSCSIGIAVTNGVPTDPRTLLRDADTALHEAKSRGRKKTVAYTSNLRSRLEYRFATERSLRSALTNGDIVPWYQPIIDVDTGRIVKAESLVRWVTKERVLLPGEFLNLANQCGLMQEIGAITLRDSLAFTALVRAEFPAFQMGVNLSIDEITRPDLLGVVRSLLAENGLPPESLVFEITETAYSEAMESDASMLQRLADFGVTLALDDFGTGWSSLLRARHYPIGLLKIDQQFTSGLEHNEVDRGIVAVLVKLSRVLRVRCTLEGVETSEQFRIASGLGVDRVQGFHFSPALPGDQFLNLLRTGGAWEQ